MNTLYLSFTGLCEFVPRYPLSTHPKNNEMRVLLADSREHPPIPHPPDSHERHLARLVCPYESVKRDPGLRTEDCSFEGKDKKYWAVFFLDDQDLFLSSIRNELEVELSEDADCPDLNPDLPDRCSFRWVGPLELISPESKIVKDDCFKPRDPDPSVISRVALTKGSICSHRIAMVDDKIIKWKFKVPGQTSEVPSRRALSDAVLYKIDFGAEVIELKTRLFRKATNPRVKEIYPRPGSELIIALTPNLEEVHASVKNMPDPDIDGTRPSGPKPEIDYHFAHVYEMSVVKKYNVPHRAGYCQGNPLEPCGLGMKLFEEFELLHRGNPNCPPPQAAAYPKDEAWNFDWPRPE